MYNGLVHLHSGLRWIVLILLIAAIVNAAMNFSGTKEFTERDRKIGLFAMISTHLQLVIGLVLYFFFSWGTKVAFNSETMGDANLRFFTVEHLLAMLIGIALITIGYSRTKRHTDNKSKFRATFWFYLIGLVVILSRIPWPGMGYGAGWG